MSRLRYLVVIYFWFVLVFVLQKPLFMFWQGDLYAGISFLDWLRVMWHGLPLDLSVSAYIMVLPMLLATVSVWLPGRWLLYIVGYTGLDTGTEDYCLWNLSLGKKFLKNNAAEIKLEAFDVLKQNRNFTHRLESNYCDYISSNVLEPYMMLSLTYTIR